MKFDTVEPLGDRVLVAPIAVPEETVLESGIIIAKSEYEKSNDEWQSDLCQVIDHNIPHDETEIDPGDLVLASRDLAKKGNWMQIDGKSRPVWIVSAQHIYALVHLRDIDKHLFDIPMDSNSFSALRTK